MAAIKGKQYVIGKGRLFFNAFLAGTKTGTGERYLGNSPELSSSQSADTLDHIDADHGLNIKDESITISNELTGAFKLDSIEPENVAMWFGGTHEQMVILAAAAIVSPDVTATKGRWYQLGATEDSPQGTRMVNNVKVATVVPAVVPTDPPVVTDMLPAKVAVNFEIDLERARIYVEDDAPDVANGTVLRFTYDQEGVTREIIIGKGDEVRGAMRFIADNPHGPNKDYYWAYVKVTSNGDYALKGDTWQEMSFNYEVLKLDQKTERVYVDGVAKANP